MNNVRVMGLLTLLIGATFFVSTSDVVAQTNMFGKSNSNSDRLRRDRERETLKKKERKLREEKLSLRQKELALKEKEKSIDDKVLQKNESLRIAAEKADEKKVYDALIRRDVIGTVLDRTSEWLIIEDETGDLLCFALERLSAKKPKNALVGQVMSTQKGDRVQVTTYTQKVPIVTALRAVKKRK